MLKEFKEFISKGNVMDLAVGVIIGAAFGAIVTALVENILTPIIGIVFGGVDFSGLSVTVGKSVIAYGAFIQAVIDFLIVAVCLFLIVKALNKAQSVAKKNKKEEVKEETPEDIKLLREIRDSLKKQSKTK